MTPRFDAYTATTRAVKPDVLLGLAAQAAGAGGLHKLRQHQGRFHGFDHRAAFRDESGSDWCSVLWGGQHRDLVMLEVTGERTPGVVAVLRREVEHSCTRVDSCADLEQPGAWSSVLAIALDVKKRHGLRGEKRGDWDYPEDGRTLMLGAASSAVRVRIYEKGKQPEYRHLERWDWVRPEVQVRPENTARTRYAAASARDVWGASPYTREIAARVLELQVKPLPPYAARRLNERDRALGWMCAHYGPHILSLLSDLGGDIEALGKEILDRVHDVRRRRAVAQGLKRRMH